MVEYMVLSIRDRRRVGKECIAAVFIGSIIKLANELMKSVGTISCWRRLMHARCTSSSSTDGLTPNNKEQKERKRKRERRL